MAGSGHNSSQDVRTSCPTGQLDAVEQGPGSQGNGALTHTGDKFAASASSADLTYKPRPDASPEAEVRALARIYRFLIECHQRRIAAEAGDDGEDADTANGNMEEVRS